MYQCMYIPIINEKKGRYQVAWNKTGRTNIFAD